MTRTEIVAWLLTAAFVAGITAFAVFSDAPFFREAAETIGGWRDPAYVPERNPAVSCQNPKNANLPYCLERKARIEADWRSISRHQDGKANAFSLRGD